MPSIMPSVMMVLSLLSLLLSGTTSAFSGNFELTNLIVSSPFQADPTSTECTSVSFDFCDQDTPEVGPTHCCVEWAVGLTPPTTGAYSCENDSFIVTVTSWHGVGNLSLHLGHQYIDNGVGQAPYNVLSKFANMTLTYNTTQYYDCDISSAECVSCDGETMIANVTEAVA